VRHLQHALQLRAEELSRAGGGEVAAGVLLMLARGREDAMALALQLSDKNAQVGSDGGPGTSTFAGFGPMGSQQ
jgi:hypothetical protein